MTIILISRFPVFELGVAIPKSRKWYSIGANLVMHPIQQAHVSESLCWFVKAYQSRIRCVRGTSKHVHTILTYWAGRYGNWGIRWIQSLHKVGILLNLCNRQKTHRVLSNAKYLTCTQIVHVKSSQNNSTVYSRNMLFKIDDSDSLRMNLQDCVSPPNPFCIVIFWVGNHKGHSWVTVIQNHCLVTIQNIYSNTLSEVVLCMDTIFMSEARTV